jgi:CRISPR-associated protein Csm3
MKLIGKLLINGEIEALTGLAIGGSKSDVSIGGIDNNVIKTAEGVPFIPGSSLKGKFRSLLERKKGKEIVCNCGKKNCEICVIFGKGKKDKTKGKEEINEAGPTRLYVRDAYLTEATKNMMENKEGIFSNLELTYTEIKWENTIDRVQSKAEHPRQQERVPAGSKFEFNMVYNLLKKDDVAMFKHVIEAMNLLEDDYLGGNGSRGYGRVKFDKLEIVCRTVADYEAGTPGQTIYTGTLPDLKIDPLIDEILSLVREEAV